jgi:hypothetical protein
VFRFLVLKRLVFFDECLVSWFQTTEAVGSLKKIPQRSLRGGREDEEVFDKPQEGSPKDIRMRPEGVLKRKGLILDLCNTSELISPFWRWEGPSTQGLTRKNRPYRMRGIANT